MIEHSWKEILKEEFQHPYMRELLAFLVEERQNHTVYPPQDLIFNAFNQTPFHKVKVVIVGQDPYHGPGQAHGLSFSVLPGVRSPPSLKNIYKELHSDIGAPIPAHGCLLSWAKQGVLLLNTILTVRDGEPFSHKARGWERFTDAVIKALAGRTEPLVFVLWGKAAQGKVGHVGPQHLVLMAPHPSPYSASSGFLGSKPFSKINAFLTEKGQEPINWIIS